MRSKKSKFIKQFFFILIFILFIFNKNYTRECIDITSNVNQKLAIQALASQLYLNNLVIKIREDKKKGLHVIQEMKSLTDAIEAGLVDLSKDVQQATETEQNLIQEADDVLEYQYSLNERAASVVDFMLSAPVKQNYIPLDLDFEFLDDKAKEEIRDTINKYNIVFKEGFNTAPEFYTHEIDELLGYVPGDPYATKATLIADQVWTTIGAAYSTSWDPNGDYVAITGDYDYPTTPAHLSIYSFDGTNLNHFVDPAVPPTIGGAGTYRSIDWSPDGGYILIGGSVNSVDPDPNNIRVFRFTESPKSVTQLTAAPYYAGYDVTSVVWHPDWDPTPPTYGGFFAAVGNGQGTVQEIQIYKIDLSGGGPLLSLADEKDWGGGQNEVNEVFDCSWSPDGKYLAVAGKQNDENQHIVLRVFEIDSSGLLDEVRVMGYNSFGFNVDWITGVDWLSGGNYLGLSGITFFPVGSFPQIAMNKAGNAIVVWGAGEGLERIIQARRYDAATDSLQEIVTLSPKNAANFQVAIDENDNAIVVWAVFDDGGLTSIIQANRYDASIGLWQSPDAVLNLSPSSFFGASSPQIAMDGNGNAIAVWALVIGNPITEIIIQANRYESGVGWQDPIAVTNLSAGGERSEKPQIAMSFGGDAVVAWRKYDLGFTNCIIKACKYDEITSSWSDIVSVSGSHQSIDLPQVAMDLNNRAIIVWQGGAGFSKTPIQTRRYKGGSWDLATSWEPSLSSPAKLLSGNINSQGPQVVMDKGGNGIVVWQTTTGYPSWNRIIQANRYELGVGWQDPTAVTNLSLPDPGASSPQIAMDGADPGNAITVWQGYDNNINTIRANRYDAITNSWQDPAVKLIISSHYSFSPQVAMDGADPGNAIAVWSKGITSITVEDTIQTKRYDAGTDEWKEISKAAATYSLKVLRFDKVYNYLSFVTEWYKSQFMSDGGVMAVKWSPLDEYGNFIAMASEPIDNRFNIVVFDFDPLSGVLTWVDENILTSGQDFCSSDVAWRPDGRHIAAADLKEGALQIYSFDPEQSEAAKGTYDGSITATVEVAGVSEAGFDVSSLTELLCQNQGKDCTKNMPVKFEVPGDYTGAAGFVDIINPACISADYGLTGILDASIEVTDSLLGARKRNYKFMQDNLKLSKRLTDVYKKSIEIKKTEQAKIIDCPGVYTFNKDVQGVIVIDADNITLDLKGHKIFSDSKIPITVNKNRKNIVIKNGLIIGGNQYLGAPSGILVKEGAQHVTLENLTITFCYEGVTFKGEQDCSVTDCLIENCAFKSNIKAASLDCSEYVTFKECEFLDCFLETVNLENNKNCCQ